MNTVPLAEVARINPRGVSIAGDEPVSFVGMAQLSADSALARPREAMSFEQVSKGYTVFANQDILAAKITPCWENGKVGQAQLDHEVGVGSTEFHVVRVESGIDARYVMHFLRTPHVLAMGELRMTGSGGQRRVPTKFLETLEVPLPPLEEQRRIAAILDHADALRAKRHQVLAHLDDLTQSIFHDMFSGAIHPEVRAGDAMPKMRNGLSPATAGGHSAEILTLSAVTSGVFDPTAVKPGLFASDPGPEKRVHMGDFLMCRGNGNLGLVGVGSYSHVDRPDLVFPDTVIAGTVDKQTVTLPYLSAVWKQPRTRRQIEAVARTTNGTYKVNQKNLSAVTLPVPPMELQRQFAERVAGVEAVGQEARNARALDDELFASLQSRAFRGEL